ncbi:JTB protein, partial [Polyodon spathula]|nr:JTB protein [Polyodon spathula]
DWIPMETVAADKFFKPGSSMSSEVTSTMSWLACSTTGFVEKINCATSKKDEYKSCRSAVMEERLFWQFEGSMVGLTLVFSFLVVVRQRALDRLASEKVRKQIESI